MHSRDRRWPVAFWFLGFELSISPIVLVIFYILTGETPQQMLSTVDWSSWDTCVNGYFVLVVAGILLTLTRFGLQARRRERIRAQALAGDDNAMPVATPTLDLSQHVIAEATEREPLTLRWANGSVVTASQEGLRWQRPRKRDVLLLWSEARLLELWESQSPALSKKEEIFEYGYCLYASRNKYVEWTDAPESQIPGARLSWEQKVQLQEELVAIVAARTDLTLRVVPKTSGSHNGRKRLTFRDKISHASVALGLFLAAFPLGAGILALTAPLTSSFVLNLYAAIIYGGAGLLILGLIVKGIIDIYRPRIPDPAPPLVVLPFVPATAMPDTALAIRFGERPRARLIAFLLLVVGLVSNVYLVIRAIQDFSISDLRHGTFTDAHKLGLMLLGTCAFIGIASLCIVLFSRPTVLTADIEGIHKGKGRKRESILWQDVAMLATNVSRPNKLKSFEVIESDLSPIGCPAIMRDFARLLAVW
jgi:hypothetical protein